MLEYYQKYIWVFLNTVSVSMDTNIVLGLVIYIGFK